MVRLMVYLKRRGVKCRNEQVPQHACSGARERMIRVQRTRDDLAKIERSRRGDEGAAPLLMLLHMCAAGRHVNYRAHRRPPHLRPRSSRSVLSAHGKRAARGSRVHARAERAQGGWPTRQHASSRGLAFEDHERSLVMTSRGLATFRGVHPVSGRAASTRATRACAC